MKSELAPYLTAGSLDSQAQRGVACVLEACLTCVRGHLRHVPRVIGRVVAPLVHQMANRGHGVPGGVQRTLGHLQAGICHGIGRIEAGWAESALDPNRRKAPVIGRGASAVVSQAVCVTQYAAWHHSLCLM